MLPSLLVQQGTYVIASTGQGRIDYKGLELPIKLLWVILFKERTVDCGLML